ncbi:MAG: LysM peptidoglycan-binding domain-containing protein [Defluviitaleaceae bacterium]|nr:LysM peptidoglycan-binding domain-containing protein [Defluviitaleaceae bacterium]
MKDNEKTRRRVQPAHVELARKKEQRKQNIPQNKINQNKKKPTNSKNVENRNIRNFIDKNRYTETNIKNKSKLKKRKQTYNKIYSKIVTIFFVISSLTILYFIFIHPNSYRVFLGDDYISNIEINSATEEGLQLSIEGLFRNNLNTDVKLVEAIRFERVNTRARDRNTVEQTINMMLQSATYLVYASSFYVDNEYIATVINSDAANTIVNLIAKNYISQNANILRIDAENLQIVNDFKEPENVTSIDNALNNLMRYTRETAIHTVVSGDSFWSIANTYNMLIEEIFELNNHINPNHVLNVGEVLFVYINIPLVNIITEEELEIFTNVEQPQGGAVLGRHRQILNITRLNGVEISRNVVFSEYIPN